MRSGNPPNRIADAPKITNRMPVAIAAAWATGLSTVEVKASFPPSCDATPTPVTALFQYFVATATFG